MNAIIILLTLQCNTVAFNDHQLFKRLIIEAALLWSKYLFTNTKYPLSRCRGSRYGQIFACKYSKVYIPNSNLKTRIKLNILGNKVLFFLILHHFNVYKKDRFYKYVYICSDTLWYKWAYFLLTHIKIVLWT